MSVWRKLKYLSPAHRRAQERDMKEELESLAAIAGPRELGNLTLAAEEARAAWGWIWFEQLYRDIQYALRTMRHSPGFTATAVLSLALGIGANSAIFNLIDALMLRWLPVHNPQELVLLRMQPAGSHSPGESFSYPIVQNSARFSRMWPASAAGILMSAHRVQSAGCPAPWLREPTIRRSA